MMRESFKKKKPIDLVGISHEDLYILLSEAVQNSDVGLVSKIIEERPREALKFEDDTKMTSKIIII